MYICTYIVGKNRSPASPHDGVLGEPFRSVAWTNTGAFGPKTERADDPIFVFR
jgi:hypothetical protein